MDWVGTSTRYLPPLTRLVELFLFYGIEETDTGVHKKFKFVEEKKFLGVLATLISEQVNK